MNWMTVLTHGGAAVVGGVVTWLVGKWWGKHAADVKQVGADLKKL